MRYWHPAYAVDQAEGSSLEKAAAPFLNLYRRASHQLVCFLIRRGIVQPVHCLEYIASQTKAAANDLHASLKLPEEEKQNIEAACKELREQFPLFYPFYLPSEYSAVDNDVGQLTEVPQKNSLFMDVCSYASQIILDHASLSETKRNIATAQYSMLRISSMLFAQLLFYSNHCKQLNRAQKAIESEQRCLEHELLLHTSSKYRKI